jgi:4-hydroxybenzoate polyprenyltransferase
MTASASDRFEAGWVARLPEPARAYAELMRLDRPIGTWLLLLPCWWGLALAGSLDWRLYLLFGIGAVTMRGAGCTINDLMDRKFDAQVARTATRPLPSGRISVPGALAMLCAQLLVGLAVLLSLNHSAIILGFAIVGVVVIYPLMKRITWWPQAVLGVAFNWGVPVGFAAAGGENWIAAATLYASGFVWTLGYDTIYAHQDKADDVKIGVKSTALRLGAQSPAWIAAFFAGMLALAAAAGALAEMAWPFWIGVAGCAGHFVRQLRALRIDDPAVCLRLFRSNAQLGWILLLGMLAARALG